ncbi:uncharacterized protein G2W53_040452 [Senna tora]|uniref:Uncharacterized protein n=1 Tax=Senna tora TaxID=362788 RepID=A0A834SE39_9FABA|nr:uncharacterized protein G2W53_040452 [Senna tora]
MIMDENEVEVSKILLQLPDLIAHTRILNSLPFGWGSKKPRTSSLSSHDNNTMLTAIPKTPLSFIIRRIKTKRNRDYGNPKYGLLPLTWGLKKPRTSSSSSRNNIGSIASPKLPPKLPVLRLKIKRNIDGKAKEEEPKRKKNKIILPDLNIPLKEEEEENGYHLANNIILPNLNIPLKKGENEGFHNVDGDLDAIILMRKRIMAAEARRRRIQIELTVGTYPSQAIHTVVGLPEDMREGYSSICSAHHSDVLNQYSKLVGSNFPVKAIRFNFRLRKIFLNQFKGKGVRYTCTWS